MGKADAILHYEDIFYYCVNNPDGGKSNHEGCDFFLPQDKAESLVVKERVAATLMEKLNMPSDNAEKLADYAVGSAKKVFLTLVYTDTIKFIGDLQSAGFKDEHLPVCYAQNSSGAPTGYNVSRLCPERLGPSGVPLKGFANWGLGQIEEFCQKQWIFLCPIFEEDEFVYKFYKEQRLPFMPADDPREGAGRFGPVQKLKLHPAHFQRRPNSDSITFDNNDEPIEVAVKSFFQGGQPAERKKFYDKEKVTLQLMNNLNNRHLVKAMATYKKGEQMYFLFPWADGGSLQDLFQKDQRQLDEALANWVWTQIVGLSHGVSQLNSKKFRHGDIKPSNILCFGTDSGASSESRLVVADVGLAKFHAGYTRNRNRSTTTRYGSMTYEPPEVFPKTGSVILSAQRYDSWSLGCVFLELVIWLLYGYGGLETFYEDLSNDPNNCRFWEDDFFLGQQKHPAVKKLIKRIKADLRAASAFRDLVVIIDRSILVSEVDRITSTDLHTKLLRIQEKVNQSPWYLYNPDIEILANGRMPIPSEVFNVPALNVTDNSLAKALLSKLVWSSLRPAKKTSSFCQYHQGFDFGVPRSSLHPSITDLGQNSNKCSLCRLLFSCLARVTTNAGDQVEILRDDASHTLRSSVDSHPIISIYSDPESAFAPAYAQIGLPLLPEPATSQQFTLLNEWIKRCDQTHNCLPVTDSTNHPRNMPTRLIDVGKRSLRLVETNNGNSGKYIAFSHCWGQLKQRQKFCTYSHNIEALKKEIPHKLLPKSFQDAVRVTRALRVPYLWIDSLCIMQDDMEDWESEASKMEEVFSSAYCTIAASSATSSVDGFLDKRNPRACVTLQTSRGPLYLAEEIDDFDQYVEQSILSKRGWVLQERALSCRTIFFTSAQVFYECGQEVLCETLATLRKPPLHVLGDSNFPASSLGCSKDEQIEYIQRLYHIYSGLQLTNIQDRPKAVLGLQNRMAQTIGSKANHGVHWCFAENLLLWRAQVPKTLTRILFQRGSAIPSWSWMSYAGAVSFIDIPSDEVNWTSNLDNPFRTGADDVLWNGLLPARANRLLIREDGLSKKILMDLEDYVINAEHWRCVIVGKRKPEEEDGKVIHYALMIRSVSPATKKYKRGGVGLLLSTDFLPETEEIVLV